VRYFFSAAILLAAAVAVAITGGFRIDVAHLRIAVRWPTELCVAAWILIVLGSRRSRLPPPIERAVAALRRYSVRYRTATAAVLVACVIGAGLVFGAFVAAGADPYGYVSQSLLWAHGNPVQFQTPLAMQSPWPNAEWSFCPIGYKPSFVSGLIVPTYAPGLPLLMAMFARPFGMRGAFIVVPLLGGLAAWSTYRLGLRVSRSHECALLSTVLTVCSPVFLFQLMQPLSDVPATAWWLTSVVAALEGSYAGALGAGLCASLAILTRPNLVVLALPVAAYAFWNDDPTTTRSRLARLALLALGLVPGVALTAAANRTFFGDPLTSGYGLLSDIYGWRHVFANVARYPAWLYTTHSPLLFVGLASAIAASLAHGLGSGERRRLVRHGVLAAAFFVTLFASYVFYIPFDHWTYLRFLLPAIPILLVLAVATVNSVAHAISIRTGHLAIGFIVVVLPLYYVSFAVHGDAFALKRLFLDRYVVTAAEIAARTSASDVVLGALQSGSLRLYGRRTTVRWDVIPPEWFDRVVLFLNRTGRTYLALESTEQIEFTSRFKTPAIAGDGARPVDPLGLVRLYGPIRPK
jgi:hypothetical protein